MKTKEAIKRNFSRYAEYYDTYSSVQDQVGLELITNLNTGEFEKILDIGCGTGNYTRLLRDKFPTATIMAVDICGKMIEVAQCKLQDPRIEFVRADAETMAPTESFGLITSNACFQWFDNLEKAIASYKNLLTNDGTILFSIFGPLTLCELSKSLGRLYEEDVRIASDTFTGVSVLSEILRKNFGHVSINERVFKKTYSSLLELLHTIKYTGTRGFGLNGQSFSKSQITKLEKIYKEEFNNITATYQIFYCRAKRKD